MLLWLKAFVIDFLFLCKPLSFKWTWENPILTALNAVFITKEYMVVGTDFLTDLSLCAPAEVHISTEPSRLVREHKMLLEVNKTKIIPVFFIC
jgi:hypothetical protein